MSSYNYMNRDDFDNYNKLASQSVKTKGAQTVQAKRGTKTTSKEKHDKKVKRLKEKCKRLLIILLVLLGLIKGISFGVESISRHNDYRNALEDFRPKLVQYLTEADMNFAISKDKEIVILDNDVETYGKLQDILSEKVGLSSHESAYVLDKICGEEAFDKSAQAMGYDDSEEFLTEKYFNGPLSNSGETYLAKYPDKRKFENNQENGVYEKLTELQKQEEAKIQEYLELKEKEKSK